MGNGEITINQYSDHWSVSWKDAGGVHEYKDFDTFAEVSAFIEGDLLAD